jgi:3',5'-cyclic-AMP phosphodiesterase
MRHVLITVARPMADVVHCSTPKSSDTLLDMSVVRLTQFTDPHLYGDENESLRGVATLPALNAALAHAKARDWPPDAVLVTGDLVQDDPAGYPHFRRVFGALGMPVLCLPGNHDEPQAMRRELAAKPFVLGGFVDMGRWRIVLLDSCIPGAASGALSADRLAMLDQALASAGTRHCMVCLHHHPVPMGSRWLDHVGLKNASEFLHTIDAHRNVRAIVWGHVHQAYDSLRKGVRMLATPSTCAQFLPHAEDFAVDRRPPAYRTLELRADGSLLTEVMWVEEQCGGSSRSACSAA